MDAVDVLPLLLEEGGKEVEGHDNVLSDLLIVEALVGDGDVKVGNLLELPLDGSLNIINLLLEWLVMGHWLWEHTNSVKHWSKDNWDLLNENIGSNEHGVLLGPLLDEFLVLVELLEVVKSDDFDVDVVVGNLIGMLLISNDADLKVWSWDVWKSDGTNETLILLWIVVLESNLELNSLGELSSLGSVSHLDDLTLNPLVGDLACHLIVFKLINDK